MENKDKKVLRSFQGVVVSDKMDKTRVVLVESVKTHKMYGKKYIQSKKYKVHDEKNETKNGDKITFIECRPLSKDKKWRLVKKNS